MKTNSIYLFLLLGAISILWFSCKTKESALANDTAVEEVAVTAPAIPKDSTFLIYKRSPCFGMCPYFDLTIYQSGYCVYEGKNFVDMVGFYHTRVESSVLQNILKTAEGIQYFSLADSYDNPHVTDLPTTTTGIMKNNVMKQVAARYKSPKELQELYQVLDEMIEASTWTSMAAQKMKN
jgi:Domain of unknown function (DUF6438)